jgi:diaminopimelate decarboxylase
LDQFHYQAGRLLCEGVRASELAESFGTPLYVYSAGTLRDHYAKLASAFGDLSPVICYSIKSCGNLGVLRVLAGQGAGMDAVSGGEVERAWLAGVPMARVAFAGVGKGEAEIRAALDGTHSLLNDPRAAGRGPVGCFNVESEQEFEAIAGLARELGVRARAALRVNPDVDARTHAYTTTGKKGNKFGVDLDRAEAFFERFARSPYNEWLTLDGVHLHLGSPIYSVEPYVDGISKALGLIDRLTARGIGIKLLNIGGGYGADYETSKSPAASGYASAIVPLLRERARAREGGLVIWMEPGRTISANAGLLLTRVRYVKEGGGKTFVICDAGMHTLIRPSLYGAFHFIWPIEPGEGATPPRRAEVLEMPGLVACDVVGPICESSDFLAKDRMLPRVKPGDVLAVFTAGAYGMSMSSRYNSQPLPAEILVDSGRAALVRRRETVGDLLSAELGPF